MARITYFDGLRALSVISVIFFHYKIPYFSSGFLGVDLFFILSGFFISQQIYNKQVINNYNLQWFIENRLRRILPALFFISIFTYPIFYLILNPVQALSYGKSLISLSFFSSNLFFLSERGYYDLESEIKPLLHTWSIGVEIQIYIVFGLLAKYFHFSSKKSFSIFFVIFLISILISEMISRVSTIYSFYLPFTRIWEMCLGYFLFFLVNKKIFIWPKKKLPSTIVLFIGLFLVCISPIFLTKFSYHPGIITLVPICGFLIIIICIPNIYFIKKFLESRVLSDIGLKSYSIYLIHYPLLLSLNTILSRSILNFIVYLFILFCLSSFSFHFVENYFRNTKIIRNNFFTITAVYLIIVLSIGFFTLNSNGWMYKYDFDKRALFTYFINAKNLPILFDKNKLIKFEDDHKKKIVLIGDSYAKDIYNSIYYSNLKDYFSISTFSINKSCGNLFLDYKFDSFIPPSLKLKCKINGWYDNAELIELLYEADEIWLASSWYEWVAKKLPESVNNLEEKYHKKVLVFGPKNFGNFDINDLLVNNIENSENFTTSVNDDVLKVNKFLKSNLDDDSYIDLIQLLCGIDFKCKIFLDKTTIISHDGAHLTIDGAKFLGEKLENFISFK